MIVKRRPDAQMINAKTAAMVAFLACHPIEAAAQAFECRFGTEPACLDYGETVCSSMGKCVSESAVCFDSYQCDYEGFTCTSNLSECADEYDDLLANHNQLVDDHNDLLERARRLGSEYDGLVADHADLRSCLEDAVSLADAQSCAY